MRLSRLMLSLRFVGAWCRRVDERFYFILAMAFVLFTLADMLTTGYLGGLDEGMFDKLIRYRVSSPLPSKDIVIVDIDERALERVGKDYGRWPWPRDVAAEALAEISARSPRAIVFNVLFSEPDPAHAEADAIFQEIAASSPASVFPFVRLPPANDAASELRASRLPGARPLADPAKQAGTVAVVLPAFSALQKNLGASNLSPDSDGIVRSYEYWIEGGGYALPSLATSAMVTARSAVPGPADGDDRKLNWRNKRGSYQRISFAEIYSLMRGGATGIRWEDFSDKIVIVGASAPGISVVKPTAADNAMDDNLILATAIDDGMNGTGLRFLPKMANGAVAVLLVVALAWAFIREKNQDTIDLTFGLGQFLLLLVTFVSVSYTNTVIDMTLPFNVGLGYFVAARAFHSAKSATESGVSRFWDSARVLPAREGILVSAGRAKDPRRALVSVRRALESEVRKDAVLHLTDVVGQKTFLGEAYENLELVLAFSPNAGTEQTSRALREAKDAGLAVMVVDVDGRGVDECRRIFWRAVTVGILAPSIPETRAEPLDS